MAIGYELDMFLDRHSDERDDVGKFIRASQIIVDLAFDMTVDELLKADQLRTLLEVLGAAPDCE